MPTNLITPAADEHPACDRCGRRLPLPGSPRSSTTTRRAGLELSAHVLRHTFVTGLVRAGNDLALVAELAGHRRLETTRRYSLPSEADRMKAVSDLEIDF